MDDLGSGHGANRAFFELTEAGLVTCGSVMVPGPWFREVAERADGHDIGVHLTLTSEWPTCRWAPISTASRASGLIDDDGYFWRDLDSLRRHLVPEAAEAELRAQIERTVAAGIQPTHLDAHMAAAMLPELLDAHVRLAEEYGAIPILPRAISWAPDQAAYDATVQGLDRAGRPVIDHFRGTFPLPRSELPSAWKTMIANLPPGITHMALHATAPGEFSAMAPDHSEWRFGEYELLKSGAVRRFCENAGVTTIGTRDLQPLWTQSAGGASASVPTGPNT